jgi:prolyl oligopeptidase
MNKYLPILLLVMLACSPEKGKQIELPPMPETPVRMVTDTLYGKTIEDPYRYLENLKDTTVEKWYKDHADRARYVLNSLAGRQGLIDDMKKFDERKSSRVFNLNISESNRYFYLKQTPADETGKLYYRDGFEGKEELLFDPDRFDPAGKQKYVISSHYPSPDGTTIALEVAPNGSESSELIIMDVTKKSYYPERMDRCWFASCSWLPDGKSFYYNRLQSADVHDVDREKDSKVYLHNVGQDASMDKEVFSRAHDPSLDIKPEEFPIMGYDKDSGFLFGYASSVDNRIKAWYAPASEIKKEKITWKKLFTLEDEVYSFFATDKEIFILTPKGAPRYQIKKFPIGTPDLSKATVVVPEFSDRSIEQFTVNNESLYLTTSKNGVTANIYRMPLATSKVEEIKLPIAAGSAYLSTRGLQFPDVWVSMSGWTQDGKRYRFNPATAEFKVETLSSEADYPEYANLTVDEVMVKSHDGVEVPLSIIYDKNVKRDGSAPVLILGYGAYGISINPFFSPSFLLWTSKGGILAVAHVRGGGELGDEWHKAGQKTTKPNTWKDLIASAEYLIANQYTSAKKIAINGGSAGGILIGRAITERPDLFAAAIPEVGCLNPLRAEASPNGPVNVPEFGTVKDSVEFAALVEMDAYLHVKDGVEYPATLITAGMNDPRVIAWQPGKFAARLTAANASGKPVLFLTDFEAGHGIGDTKTKQFESLSDMLSFAFWQTGHSEFQISKDPIQKETPENEVKVTQ